MIDAEHADVAEFYGRLGWEVMPVLTLGKNLDGS
jgi:hypothetical protein